MAEFFQLLLTEEINAMPRRALYQAREKLYSVDDQQSAQKKFYSFIRNYLREEHELAMQSLESGRFNIAYLLYSYEAPGDRNAEGVIVKRHIVSHWRSYEETFGILLAQVMQKVHNLGSGFFILLFLDLSILW